MSVESKQAEIEGECEECSANNCEDTWMKYELNGYAQEEQDEDADSEEEDEEEEIDANLLASCKSCYTTCNSYASLYKTIESSEAQVEGDEEEEQDEVEYLTLEDMADYASCTAIVEQDEDEYGQVSSGLYWGPHCSSSGGIKWSAFSDPACTTFYNGAYDVETLMEKKINHNMMSFMSSSDKHSCDGSAQEYKWAVAWDSEAEQDVEVDEYGNETPEMSGMCASAFEFGMTCWKNFPTASLPYDYNSAEDYNACMFAQHAENGDFPEIDEIHYNAQDTYGFHSTNTNKPSVAQKIALGLFVPATVLFGASAVYFHSLLANPNNKSGNQLSSMGAGGAMA
jgi:hypothetical protein